MANYLQFNTVIILTIIIFAVIFYYVNRYFEIFVIPFFAFFSILFFLNQYKIVQKFDHFDINRDFILIAIYFSAFFIFFQKNSIDVLWGVTKALWDTAYYAGYMLGNALRRSL